MTILREQTSEFIYFKAKRKCLTKFYKIVMTILHKTCEKGLFIAFEDLYIWKSIKIKREKRLNLST